MKVYLDTNVWIQGSKRRACERLKNLALEGTIKLYLSPTAQHEQSAQSSRLDKREQELLGQPDGGHTWEALRAVGQEKERTERSEEAEREWWRPVVLEYPGSTFEGLLTIAMSGNVDPALDVKDELPLLTELLEAHNIPQTDAMHVMSAHSAEMDFFLTWDWRLVTRARQVPWLHSTLETPDEFLRRFDASE